MLKLMNSAMMPQPGYYKLVRLTEHQFMVAIMEAGVVDSYVGYPQTAAFVEVLTGVKIEVSRRQTVLLDGESVLIIKLTYRLQEWSDKTKPVDESQYEFYMATYKEQ